MSFLVFWGVPKHAEIQTTCSDEACTLCFFSSVTGTSSRHYLLLIVHPIIYKVLAPSKRWLLGDFRTINSIIKMVKGITYGVSSLPTVPQKHDHLHAKRNSTTSLKSFFFAAKMRTFFRGAKRLGCTNCKKLPKWWKWCEHRGGPCWISIIWVLSFFFPTQTTNPGLQHISFCTFPPLRWKFCLTGGYLGRIYKSSAKFPVKINWFPGSVHFKYGHRNLPEISRNNLFNCNFSRDDTQNNSSSVMQNRFLVFFLWEAYLLTVFLACLEAFSTHAWEIWCSTKPKSSTNHRFRCPSHWWRCSTRFRCLQRQADVTTGRIFFQPPPKKWCNLPDLIVVFFWNSMVSQSLEEIILFFADFLKGYHDITGYQSFRGTSIKSSCRFNLPEPYQSTLSWWSCLPHPDSTAEPLGT